MEIRCQMLKTETSSCTARTQLLKVILTELLLEALRNNLASGQTSREHLRLYKLVVRARWVKEAMRRGCRPRPRSQACHLVKQTSKS